MFATKSPALRGSMTESDKGVGMRDTYATVRTWYQEHIDQPIAIGDHFRIASAPLVRALPEVARVTDVEVIAVFREVIAGRLEWAHQVPGGREMTDRVRVALQRAGRSYSLTLEEEEELKTSVLWPFIKR
jgi:hypothetical protein